MPNFTDYVITLLLALSGQTIFLGAVVFISKTYFEHRLKRNYAEFEMELEKKLGKFSQRHNLYVEKQLEVFSVLYVRLKKTEDALRRLGFSKDAAEYDNKKAAYDLLYFETHDYFNENQFFFSEKLSDLISVIIARFADGKQALLKAQDLPENAESFEAYLEEAGVDCYSASIAINEVRDKFRRILSTGE